MCQRFNWLSSFDKYFSPKIFTVTITVVICQLSLLSVLHFFLLYRFFRMNSYQLRIARSFFSTPNISNAFSIYSLLLSMSLPFPFICFYICMLKRKKASIVLRKSNRLKKIFFGIFLFRRKRFSVNAEG